jgi:uncharacterized protein YggT (Ycf19 family)
MCKPLLVQLSLTPAAQSTIHLWQEAFVLGIASFLVWKWLLVALLLLYIVNSYVYLGTFSFLDFMNTTVRNLLRIFDKLPLRTSKVDLSPFLMLAFVLAISELLARSLPLLYRRLPF